MASKPSENGLDERDASVPPPPCRSKVETADAAEIKLTNQLNQSLRMMADVRRVRGCPIEAREARYLEKFFSEFICSRNKRANDVESLEVKRAVEIQKKLFGPYATFGVLCIDGRVLPHLLGGFTAGYGGFLRLPAAEIADFKPSTEGGFMLPRGSRFANQFSSALERNNGHVVQILDSHIDCAARKLEEEAKGCELNDKGLLADVGRKHAQALAMLEYARAHHSKDTVMPIQITFNPGNGFSYMGLETDDALARGHEKGGFPNEVLEELVREQKIISTKALSELPDVKTAFEKHSFSNDWEEDYRNTALTFWEKLEEMSEEVLPAIELQLKMVFPHLANEEYTDELRQRAMLLLSSAWSGYLNNNEGDYEYKYHPEDVVVVSERENGPYSGISAFSVYSEGPNMASDVAFASGIVRGSRGKAGGNRVTDPTGQYPEGKDYKKAPVTVVVKEIFRGQVADFEWDKLGQVDWSGLQDIDWSNEAEFKQFLSDRKIDMPLSVFEALNDLRTKMAALYANSRTGEYLADGNLAAISAIVDSNRRIRAIVPFVSGGL